VANCPRRPRPPHRHHHQRDCSARWLDDTESGVS
jgi:hypothetical protein